MIWLGDSGMSYSRKVNVSSGYTSIGSEFVCDQTKQSINIQELETQLSQTHSLYYLVHLGGASQSSLLIKTGSTTEEVEYNVRWNALNFLHCIGWIGNTGKPLVTKSQVLWVPNEKRISIVAEIPPLDIHWVWFRRPGYKLTQEIIERSYSWIAFNPECKFHLWTDIPTLEDLDDFMSLIESDWRGKFRARVDIHLDGDTKNQIESSLQDLKSTNTKIEFETGVRLFREELNSKEKQSRIYKTDFVRLLILCTFGGIYTDFNDCVCLSPIRDIIGLYGYDTPLGVSDFYDTNNASNYFLYCPPPNEKSGYLTWRKIVEDMIEHLQYSIASIRNMELCALVRKYTENAILSLNSETMTLIDTSELERLYHMRALPHCNNENIDKNKWNKFIWILVGDVASSSIGNELRVKIQPRIDYAEGRRRRHRNVHQSSFSIIDDATINLLLEYIKDDSVYNQLFLFWWTDYNLRVVMHYTNLPIFCRMRQIPLSLLPFGYLLRYCCALSWIGHIGDGTSYGMDGRKDGIQIRKLLSDSLKGQ